MTLNFRNSHLSYILKACETERLPLDVFLRLYFKNNRSIGSHDRKYIAETTYKMVRWQGLIDFFCKEDLSFANRLQVLEKLDPESHLHDDSIPIHTRLSFPEELFTFLVNQIGEDKAKEFCLESNFPAPITIRTNTAKISREDLFNRLSQTQEITLGLFSSTAIHFAHRVNFLVLPEFKEGFFEAQDEASQIASIQVAAKPGDHFLDYCAGSGGKSLAIAPQMKGKGQLYLHDIRPNILIEAKKRLNRAGIQNMQIIPGEDLKKKNLHGKMDWVLVDAPCSGSGTLRRNPDMKWKLDVKNLANTVSLQREIFAKALTFVKPKGYIVYATCSVFPLENEEQLDFFLKEFPVKLASPPFKSFPSRNGMDGFYSVVLQKC